MLNVLIVDDIEINIKVISSILSFRKNINIMSAVCAADAITLLNSNEFDVVITDIFMPEMDGFQLADIINTKFDNLPIIAVSAGNTEIQKKCVQHNIDFYLQKPVIPSDLYKIIDDISDTSNETIKPTKKDVLPDSVLLTRLKEYSGGNIVLLKKLLQKFIEILPMRLEEITNLLEKDLQKVIEDKIHNLKGFSLIYVSENTGNLIKEFEQVVKNSSFQASKNNRIEIFKNLKLEIEKDFNELNDIFSNL